MGIARGGALAAALCLTLVGCGEDTSSARPDSSPVISSATGRPGTTLGDGFIVVDDTTLIGDPIPLGISNVVDGAPVREEGWTAESIVDGGEPSAIIASYLDQAERAGLTDQTDAGCAVDPDQEGPTKYTPLGLVTMVCSGSARTADDLAPQSVSVQVFRGEWGDMMSNHVKVTFTTDKSAWSNGADEGGDEGVDVPVTMPWPPLPAVRETVGTAGVTAHSLVIEQGSRVAGPTRGTPAGVALILEVTGDPRAVLQTYLDQAVLQTYLDQLEEAEMFVEPPVEFEVGDALLTTAQGSSPGGDDFKLRMIERPGRPTWLAVDGSYD